ncbi:MAG: hypothetical protein HY720_08270, partial [Planctomycetes bacterium]|nr:hypothetical protein [Planctomycetota bacterium]
MSPVDIQELVRHLEGHPDDRGLLRKCLLADDPGASDGFQRLSTALASLAERVEELAQAQARTEKRVEELAQAQARTEKRVEELAQAQART